MRVTLPLMVLPGRASNVTFTGWPSFTRAMSVSLRSVVSTRSEPRSPSVTIGWPGCASFTRSDVHRPDRSVERRDQLQLIQLRLRRIDGHLRLLHARFGHGDLFGGRAGLQQIELRLGLFQLRLGGVDVGAGCAPSSFFVAPAFN